MAHVWNELNNILDLLATDRSIISPTTLVADSSSCAGYHHHVNENEQVIEVPLVGIEKENVKIEVENNKLLVTASTNEKSRFARNFSQSWILAQGCQIDEMKAELKNGLLKVVIPRLKKNSNKKVITLT